MPIRIGLTVALIQSKADHSSEPVIAPICTAVPRAMVLRAAQAVRRYTKNSAPSKTASADNRLTYTSTTIRANDHEGREDAYYEKNRSGNTATDLFGSDRSFAGAAATAIASCRSVS